MKKSGVLILGLLVSSIFLSALVLAQNTGMSDVIGSIGDIVKSVYNAGVQPLAQFMIGPDSAGDATTFFTLILMLVLLVSVLWEITNLVPFLNHNSWVQFIVSFAIALISIRFLGQAGNAAWFQTVLLPNQALGIALLCLIPFVLYFFFVMDIGKSSKTLAKILWIFAAVLFAVLYFTRADAIGKTSSGFNPANIYLLAAIVSFAFLWFDGTVRKWMNKIDIEKAQYTGHARTRAALTDLLNTVRRNYEANTAGYTSIYSPTTAKGWKSYKHDLDQINKDLAHIS